METPDRGGGGAAAPADGAALRTGGTASTCLISTITGQHVYTINGYSLVKGIGDGEPIASERFLVGG